MLTKKRLKKRISMLLALAMVLAVMTPAMAFADEFAEEPVEQTVEEPAEEPIEEPEGEIIEEPAEEPIEEPAGEIVEEPAEEIIEEPTEEPTGEFTEEPAAELMVELAAEAPVDYSDPAILAAALLEKYTKDFDHCDSTAGSGTTAAKINEALDGWNAVYKSWAIIKKGGSKYVLLTEEDVNEADVDSYIEVTKVDGDRTEKGIIKVVAGNGYQIMDAKSFIFTNGKSLKAIDKNLKISAEYSDLEFLHAFLNDAVALAKTYVYDDGYGSKKIATRIDSSAIDANTGNPGFNYLKLVRAIEELCGDGGKYAMLDLRVDYEEVAWCLLTNGNDKVTDMYFAADLNNEEFRKCEEGDKIGIYRYFEGEKTYGLVTLMKSNSKDNVMDYSGSYIFKIENFTETEEPTEEEPAIEEPAKKNPVEEEPAREEPAEEEPAGEEPAEEEAVAESSDRSGRGGKETTPGRGISVIEDVEVPLSGSAEEVSPAEAPAEEIVIAEEEVPLGNVPQTGDSNNMFDWLLLAVLSLLGMALLAIRERQTA